jgi:hypothetical protein
VKQKSGFKLEDEIIEMLDRIGRVKYKINTNGKRTQVLRMLICETFEGLKEEKEVGVR